eukprot:6041484-Prymnesium_polylepis.1
MFTSHRAESRELARIGRLDEGSAPVCRERCRLAESETTHTPRTVPEIAKRKAGAFGKAKQRQTADTALPLFRSQDRTEQNTQLNAKHGRSAVRDS